MAFAICLHFTSRPVTVLAVLAKNVVQEHKCIMCDAPIVACKQLERINTGDGVQIKLPQINILLNRWQDWQCWCL